MKAALKVMIRIMEREEPAKMEQTINSIADGLLINILFKACHIDYWFM